MYAQVNTGRDYQSLVDWNCFHYESRIFAEYRRQMRKDLEKSRLSLATGLRREDWVEKLWSMGIRDDNYTALYLLPLAMVGWADGVMERKESEIAMEGVGSLNPPVSAGALELFQQWLKQRPDPFLWKVWETLVLTQSDNPAGSTEAPPVDRVAEWTEKVAESSGGILGIGKVCNAEQAVLDRVNRYVE